MARRPTAAQLREKRSRTIAIGASVLFLIVIVIQGPKLLKTLHGGAAPQGGAVAGALPAGVNPTLPTATTTGSTAAAAVDGHLGKLSRFPFRDPFRALVKDAGAGTAGTTGGAGTSEPKPAKTEKSSPAAAAAAAVGPTVTFTATKVPPNAAVVKTNGRRQIVFIGDAFPTKDPLFKLIALGKKNIRIGVLGGSFTSGLPTIKLAKGKRMTLANKADGSHYVLQLLRLTVATPPAKTTDGSTPAPAATTTTATTTQAPATTTPATTTTAG